MASYPLLSLAPTPVEVELGCGNKNCYQIVPNDPCEKVKAENDRLVQNMLIGGEISDNVAEFLQNGDKKLSNFYHIVKTHKIPPPKNLQNGLPRRVYQ